MVCPWPRRRGGGCPRRHRDPARLWCTARLVDFTPGAYVNIRFQASSATTSRSRLRQRVYLYPDPLNPVGLVDTTVPLSRHLGTGSSLAATISLGHLSGGPTFPRGRLSALALLVSP